MHSCTVSSWRERDGDVSTYHGEFQAEHCGELKETCWILEDKKAKTKCWCLELSRNPFIHRHVTLRLFAFQHAEKSKHGYHFHFTTHVDGSEIEIPPFTAHSQCSRM